MSNWKKEIEKTFYFVNLRKMLLTFFEYDKNLRICLTKLFFKWKLVSKSFEKKKLRMCFNENSLPKWELVLTN